MLTPVQSSNLKAVGYDRAAQRLFVEFKSGAVVAYDGVEPELHEDLVAAPSAGEFFHREIRSRAVKTIEGKSGTHPYTFRYLDPEEIAELKAEAPTAV